MIFLIEYDRRKERLVKFQEFQQDQQAQAEQQRLDIELDLNHRGIEHEVVLLEAVSEDALRRTHRRYFENLSQLSS